MPSPLGHSLLLAVISLASIASEAADRPPPWALQPIAKPAIPKSELATTWAKNPIDHFIAAKLETHQLTPSPPASTRTLLRRLHLNLHGLPPSPGQIEEFRTADRSSYIDSLLADPAYGERWARHWMDTVHYAETHGHDEDAIRPNAWPYRDYLIDAFNHDRPYARFVREQVAGDVLFPDDPQATVATAFLAVGPWDSSSQMGIQDGTTDKKIAQLLDRDDILTNTMSTFVSTTVHCARCHDHKFDPVSASDYYALQAVFAGVDRADRPYDPDPELHRQRHQLTSRLNNLTPGSAARIATTPEYTTWLADIADTTDHWTVLPPGTVTSTGGSTATINPDGSVTLGGTPRPDKDTTTITTTPSLEAITAIRLELLTDPSLPHHGPGRQDNGNLHLSKISVELDGHPVPLAAAAADFNQGGWTIQHAIDDDPATAWGIYPEVGKPHTAVFTLANPLRPTTRSSLTVHLAQLHGGGHLIGRPRLSTTSHPTPKLTAPLPPAINTALAPPRDHHTLTRHFLQQQLDALPPPSNVFAVTSHFDAIGNFKPPGPTPREVHLLDRGDILSPGAPATPGALSCLDHLPARFDLDDPTDEGARRAALAEWLAHPDNPLTWRSIVNRVWHHHFGHGLVRTPNDFGAMGDEPSHPQLLDWLASEFRDRGGSLKWLHHLITNSATYAQSSAHRDAPARIDADNRLLWRMHRPRLDAESLRDTVLALSGKLDRAHGGPSARHFTESKGVHVTPDIDYINFDPDHPANFRRGVYRFVFRTVPDPLMQALDCPDASQLTPTRTTTFTAPQALALLNSPFLVRQSEHLAARLTARHPDAPSAQVTHLYNLTLLRDPNDDERTAVTTFARTHGLANACRVLLNTSEFLFVE